MNCQVTILDLCQLKQETFHSPTFGFGDIDVSNDQFIFSTFKSFGSAKKEHPVNWVDENTVYIESLNLPFGDYFHELIWIHGTQRDVVVQGRLKVTDKGNDCGCEPKNNYEIKVVTSETTVNVNYSERVIERITDKGPQGDSAYQGAVENGFVGTEAEWLESLKLHYSDLTEAEILELQQPAIEAAQTANTAADNANTATQNAITATNEANTATTNANDAANNANTSATNANNSADLATSAATNANNAATAANTAADFANSQRGWSPKFVFEEDGTQRLVKKLDSWIGGTGTAPTDNVGMYIADGGYTTDKSLAENFKGAMGDNLLFEYVHSGNKEVHIESYDENTGYFTATNHGLVNGRNGNFLLNDGVVENQTLIMFPVSVDWGYPITVIDSDTFYLGSILQTPVNLDLSKFHFEEYTNTSIVNFTGFSEKAIRVHILSKGFRLLDWFNVRYLSVNDLNLTTAPIFVKNSLSVNNQSNRITALHSNINASATYVMSNGVLNIVSEISTYMNGTNQLDGYLRRVIFKPTTSTFITKFNGLSFIPNGATIKIYKL